MKELLWESDLNTKQAKTITAKTHGFAPTFMSHSFMKISLLNLQIMFMAMKTCL